MSATRIPEAEMTSLFGAVTTKVGTKMCGTMPEPLEVMWHNKRVLRTYLGLGQKAARWSRCDESLKCYAHLAVAALVGCSWCLDLGYFQANNEGLDLTKAREVPRWRESEAFTPLESDVLEYAEAVSMTPPTVGADGVAGMTGDPFVDHRSLLFTVAYEMLGSAADAEDVVQETWLWWAAPGWRGGRSGAPLPGPCRPSPRSRRTASRRPRAA